jgi:[protein-PII] uridylyltransferase
MTPPPDPFEESVHRITAKLVDCRNALDQKVRQGSPGLETAWRYSECVDTAVREMLTLSCEMVGRGASPESVPAAIVATGGYGRRELCPHSDIDITFIPHRDGDPLVDRIIKQMFTLLVRVFMDGAGVTVGYAYRLVEDCGYLDHQTRTGLMDARLIAGSSRLFIRFENDFWGLFNPAEFIFSKLAERRRIRAKYGETPRLVEPNLKEGPGGMRDLQTALWVTQARVLRDAAGVRGENGWSLLRAEADVPPEEIEQLRAAKEALFRTRNALHVATGAERDQLVVTRQEQIASLLQIDGTEDHPAVECMMRELYQHTAAVHRISDMVMRRMEHSRLFLGIGLDCKRLQVVPQNSILQHESPCWTLLACELAQKYGLGISAALARAALAVTSRNPELQDAAWAGEIFTRILTSRNPVYPVMQTMADLGILNWILPEFGRTMDLIPYDPSHDHSVGQHTLYVLRYLDTLKEAHPGEELRDMRQLMAELPHPERLYLAALLHDAGKFDHSRPHAEVGEDLARSVCRRLGWSTEATEDVAFLVLHHQLMDETSRLRDLGMEETIRDFTAVVDDPDRLQMLYLLTYADSSAVGGGVWTQVKERFLRDLYRRAERALAGEEAEEFDDAHLTRMRRRLLKELSVESLPAEEVAAHVGGMPASYLLNTSLEDISLHIGFTRKALAGEPVIDFRDERGASYTEVTVCTLDDPEPGLLSKIAGVLCAADLNVHSAQVYTRVVEGVPRIAIDSLMVDFRGRQLTPGKRKEVSTGLIAVLTGQTGVGEILAKRRKSAQTGGEVERISVRNDVSDKYTLVELAGRDPMSLLYRSAGALGVLRWDILSARLSMFAGRQVVSFYVAGARHLSDDAARRELLRLMPETNEPHNRLQQIEA